ncbi:MAG: ribosome silencing factor [Pyrinomonadaceae bacterium MAG19_C2-C3]|nr:ribosome silencing factor [Pyrinomonadaceae bacterium MAG19_C2-C3]
MNQNPLETNSESHTSHFENDETPRRASGSDAPQAELDERMLVSIFVAEEKKAQDIIALNLQPVASFTDFFIIASGANQRQVQAIADDVILRLKKMGTRVVRVEGYQTGEWVLLDYGDFVMHIFEAKARQFFDLERLWRDAPRVRLEPAKVAEAGVRSTTSLADKSGEA